MRLSVLLLRKMLCLCACMLLLTACYETKNLPADETLYTGITDYKFGTTSYKKMQEGEEEGIITAFNEAYNTLESVLDGDLSVLRNRKKVGVEFRAFEDSVKHEEAVRQMGWADAKAEVDGVLAYAPNNSLFGSSRYRFPLPVGLWIYNRYVDSKHRFGKWMFNTFAADPRYISSANPKVRVQVARSTLRNYGYFRGETSYEVVPQRNPRKAKIAYHVTPHELFRLDTIEYQQFQPSADSIIRATKRHTLLHQGDPFNIVNLDGERTRLSTLFRNNGYYFFQPDFITYRADTIQREQWVQMQVRPSADIDERANTRYCMGRTTIHLFKHGDFVITDSIMRRGMRFYYGGGEKKPPMRPGAIRKWLFYRRGGLYNQDLMDAVRERLTSMGTFSQISMTYTAREKDTLQNDSTRMVDSIWVARRDSLARRRGGAYGMAEQRYPDADTLDVDIMLVLDKPYDAEFQGSVTNKTNGLVGPGVSFSMSKRNAFRGAEALSFSAYGSYEWQTGAHVEGNSQVVNSYEYGASLDLQYPRLMLFGLLNKFNRRALTSTTYKLDANWLNRSGYFGRVNFGGRIVYNYQRKPTVKHELVPIHLEYNHQLHTTSRFDSIASANQALYVSMRDQFVSSMQYTYSISSPRNARNPRSFTLMAKEAGNLLDGVYGVFGKNLRQSNKKIFNVPFAQYFKLTAEFTDKVKLGSTNTYLAGRLFAGAVWSFGNSTIAPYSDLFSIGGANSIRAFAVRSIGPGAYHPASSSYSYINQVGDLKLEANLEYRFPLVGNLEGAAFVDAGNVWLMKPSADHPGGSFRLKDFGREIALGTGLGIRYDLSFLIVRFDVGVGLHAPYDTGKSGYYNMPRFKNSLGYHLAIGYPF